MYLLRTICPRCGGKLASRNATVVLLEDIPDTPDVPWVNVDWDKKRFDTCTNGHNINIRPYVDYDDHYIYDDMLGQRINELTGKLKDLKKLKEKNATSRIVKSNQ